MLNNTIEWLLNIKRCVISIERHKQLIGDIEQRQLEDIDISTKPLSRNESGNTNNEISNPTQKKAFISMEYSKEIEAHNKDIKALKQTISNARQEIETLYILTKLNESQYKTIMQFYFDGLSAKDIASDLKYTEGYVYEIKSHAINAIHIHRHNIEGT